VLAHFFGLAGVVHGAVLPVVQGVCCVKDRTVGDRISLGCPKSSKAAAACVAARGPAEAERKTTGWPHASLTEQEDLGAYAERAFGRRHRGKRA